MVTSRDVVPFSQCWPPGILFHFGQCILKNIQELGHQSWYNEPGHNNALLVKTFNALAFVPIHLGPDALNALLDSLDDELDELLTDFLFYFQTTWNRAMRPKTKHNIPNCIMGTSTALMGTSTGAFLAIYPEQRTQSKDGIMRGFGCHYH